MSNLPSSPIADLSYRNYDGPLNPPSHRWWAITKMCIRLSTKKRGFWIAACISAYWYLILGAIFFFLDVFGQSAPGSTGGKNPLFASIVWKDQFINAFSMSQLLLFIIALQLGAGAIANDNRAKALLVYLSKPCTKGDYLIGKWFGVFIPITIVCAIPTFAFYGYCLMSYRNYGFLSDDPWLIFKLMGMVLLPGFFHASVSLGISSMFDQGRLAGASYAGLYFISLFFTKIMQIMHNVNSVRGGGRGTGLVDMLYYFAVDGIQIGLAKVLLGSPGSGLIPANGPGNRQMPPIPIPNAPLMWGLFFGISFVFMWIAWTRIRAVEVVG